MRHGARPSERNESSFGSGFEIRAFDATRPTIASDISDLHGWLLPHSPVCLLGRAFMEGYYYQVLPQEGLVFGAVAYVDGHPVGFIAATTESNGFARRAIRRHPWRLGWLIGRSLLRDPGRIAAVWEGVQIMRHVDPPPRGRKVGELLSFGVLPEFTNPVFVRKTGNRISASLLACAMKQLAERGTWQVRSLVDDDNLAAKFFYHTAGWSLGNAKVKGWKQPVVEFLWQFDPPVAIGSAGAPRRVAK